MKVRLVSGNIRCLFMAGYHPIILFQTLLRTLHQAQILPNLRLCPSSSRTTICERMTVEIFPALQLHTTPRPDRTLKTLQLHFPFSSLFPKSAASLWLIAFPTSETLTLVSPDWDAKPRNSDLLLM